MNLTNLPGLCTGCGLCRDVCFNKAVTVTPVPSELSALRPAKLGLKPAPKDNETLWEDRLQAMMPDVPIYPESRLMRTLNSRTVGEYNR